jgi:hypothetical protein
VNESEREVCVCVCVCVCVSCVLRRNCNDLYRLVVDDDDVVVVVVVDVVTLVVTLPVTLDIVCCYSEQRTITSVLGSLVTQQKQNEKKTEKRERERERENAILRSLVWKSNGDTHASQSRLITEQQSLPQSDWLT